MMMSTNTLADAQISEEMPELSDFWEVEHWLRARAEAASNAQHPSPPYLSKLNVLSRDIYRVICAIVEAGDLWTLRNYLSCTIGYYENPPNPFLLGLLLYDPEKKLLTKEECNSIANKLLLAYASGVDWSLLDFFQMQGSFIADAYPYELAIVSGDPDEVWIHLGHHETSSNEWTRALRSDRGDDRHLAEVILERVDQLIDIWRLKPPEKLIC